MWLGRPTALRFGAAIFLGLVAGCSSSPEGEVQGPLLTSVGGSGEGMAAQVTGPLAYAEECLRLGDYPVIWPEGTAWAEPDLITLPSGEQVEVGTRLDGGGGYLNVAAVVERFGQQVADAAERCLGDSDEVAVFNPGSEVSVGS